MTRTPVYCTTQDVANKLRLSSGGVRTTFSTLTDPTDLEVQERIMEAEDMINITCNDAWFLLTSPVEYYEADDLWMDWQPYELLCPLKQAHVQTFSKSSGDILQVRQGNIWVDLLDGTHTEGIGQDYWVEYDHGIIHFFRTRPNAPLSPIMVQYRYGNLTVPYDIKKAAINIVSADLLESDFQTVLMSNGEGFVTDRYKTAEKWRDEANNIMSQHWRVFVRPLGT